MLPLLALLRRLANDDRRAVVVGAAALLFTSGIAVAAVGIATHQPAVTRVGFAVLIITIIYATVAVRARRHQGDDRPPSINRTDKN
jgi:hypothetical protein